MMGNWTKVMKMPSKNTRRPGAVVVKGTGPKEMPEYVVSSKPPGGTPKEIKNPEKSES